MSPSDLTVSSYSDLTDDCVDLVDDQTVLHLSCVTPGTCVTVSVMMLNDVLSDVYPVSILLLSPVLPHLTDY